MDARVPAVVAVVVTKDPGPWFEETLAALAAQDYEDLSVLVLVAGGTEDPTERVAAVVPDAYVRRLDEDRGFAWASNQALGMVEGASFYLFCHDDCAPDPDAIHLLVEESYRSNAAVVSPKMVRWDDPRVLLHVGRNADKTGAVVERVAECEVDHGQHDAVRDVFVAPGGFTLVRADLFEELGGFDAGIVAMAEDLDFSWRAQVAGARVVVAPDARIRHLEPVSGGIREAPAPTAGAVPASLQALERRHELRAVLKNYSTMSLIRVLPQALLLAIGEVIVALAGRDMDRAKAVAGAWSWNLSHRKELRSLRSQVRAHRRFPDKEVRKLQVRGSARLSTFFSRLTHQGLEAAQGHTAPEPEADEGPELTGSLGGAFSDDTDFDELDDLGHRERRGRRHRGVMSTRPARALAWLAAALVLVVGSRNLFATGLPLIGQFGPMTSWTSTWGHLFAAWQPSGVGTTAPATPAFAILGTLGTVFFGGMGLTQKVLVLGAIPFGAWGMSRFLRPMASPRARLIAALAYLGLGLSYDALARGRWDGLIAYAAAPWLLARLARAAKLAPFTPADLATSWRSTLGGEILVLAVAAVPALAFAPALAPALVLAALGVAAGALCVGQWRGSLRTLGVTLGALVVAAVLLAPWVIGTLLAGKSALGIFGLAGSVQGQPNWGALLRFDVGPVGSSPLSWLLIAAALLPLLIGRQQRLAWAARLWCVALAGWLGAWVVSQHWSGSFAPSIDVLLAPAAVAIAACVGLGVAAFESDLSGYSFGWRQIVTALAVVAAVVGLVPAVIEAGDGRWGLPATGFAEPLSFLANPGTADAYRVLWLGDPRAVPLGGWSITRGLAYATTENGTPAVGNIWAPAGPGPSTQLASAVTLAESNGTRHLGRLLAPSAVAYVVVVDALAPTLDGLQTTTAYPPPAGLLGSLLAQSDLREIPGGGGYTVFANTEYLPERAQRAGALAAPVGLWPAAADVAGWSPAFGATSGATSYSGHVAAGTVVALTAPAGGWHLDVAGRTVKQSTAFGWAAQFAVAPAGSATLSFDGGPLVPLGVGLEMLAWLGVLGALAGRARWLDWWAVPLRRRRSRKAAAPASEADAPVAERARHAPAGAR